MSCSILRLLLVASAIAFAAWTDAASAATAQAKIARIRTAVATLEGVRVQLDWPDAATQGVLRLQAARIDAPGLGYRFRDVTWQCPLSHAGNRWQCEGAVREGRSTALTLAIDIDDTRTDASLARGRSRIALNRESRTPDLTRIDLAQVPVTWAQALMSQAWAAGRFGKGTLEMVFYNITAGKANVDAAPAVIRPLLRAASTRMNPSSSRSRSPSTRTSTGGVSSSTVASCRTCPGSAGRRRPSRTRSSREMVSPVVRFVVTGPTVRRILRWAFA